MRTLFGTDGMRGIAGDYPLDPPTVYATGLALGHSLAGRHDAPRVVLGHDTRESSAWIGAALARGLRDAGATVASAGVLTTPGVAYLARTHGFGAGVVVSASHNPWRDNGIKIFGHDGYKLSDATELAIEEEIFARRRQPAPAGLPGPAQGHAIDAGEGCELRAEYEQWLRSLVPGLSLDGMKVIVDCANGAASTVAPELFRQFSGRVEFTHHDPDGRNINEGCGALHPEVVAREVVARKADLGITFDGDADRALFADARGRVVNGDAVMLLAARDMKAHGTLAGDTVVATTMSNMGLEAALRRSGIRMLRAPVGDKYVLEQMRRSGAVLGGEQSGHIIFSGLATTGDGLLTALQLLAILARAGRSLDELVGDLKVYPQIITNVRVREKRPLEEIPAVAATIRTAEADLDGSGRVVVRYSGTESLARVMIEAESEDRMKRHASAIADAIQSELGV